MDETEREAIRKAIAKVEELHAELDNGHCGYCWELSDDYEYGHDEDESAWPCRTVQQVRSLLPDEYPEALEPRPCDVPPPPHVHGKTCEAGHCDSYVMEEYQRRLDAGEDVYVDYSGPKRPGYGSENAVAVAVMRQIDATLTAFQQWNEPTALVNAKTLLDLYEKEEPKPVTVKVMGGHFSVDKAAIHYPVIKTREGK